MSKGKPQQQYVYAFNGFAAELTSAEAAELAGQPDVVAVTPDELVESETTDTPAFLGLDAPGGLWEQLGGPDGTTKTSGAGDDIVIGVIDSGIWPDSPSFSDRAVTGKNGKVVYTPVKFAGACETGEAVGDDSWDQKACNKKLVGARHFNAGWGGDQAIAEQMPWEFLSPRDYNGHGTHTAATAAGYHGVAVTGPGAEFGKVSGIAPRARVAAYKALGSAEDGSTANGFNSDIVAAIDQAVADGVDVINFSVSGRRATSSTRQRWPSSTRPRPESSWRPRPATTARRRARWRIRRRGSPPWPPARTTAASPARSPWATARSTRAPRRQPERRAGPLHRRCRRRTPRRGRLQAEAVLRRGRQRRHPCSTRRSSPARSCSATAAQTPRVNKSRAVAEAGGIGMVLVNVDADNVVADFHAVPTVHVATPSAAPSRLSGHRWGDGHDRQGEVRLDTPAPTVAAFSSRGPSSAAGGDLLKPDLLAPGQDIMAAVAPPGKGPSSTS